MAFHTIGHLQELIKSAHDSICIVKYMLSSLPRCPVAPSAVLFGKSPSVAPMRGAFSLRKWNILASWRPNIAHCVRHPRRGSNTLSATDEVPLQQPGPEGDVPCFCRRPRVGVRPFPSLVRGPPAENPYFCLVDEADSILI